MTQNETLKLYGIRCNFQCPYRGPIVDYEYVFAYNKDSAISLLKEHYRTGFGVTRINEIYSIEEISIKEGVMVL